MARVGETEAQIETRYGKGKPVTAAYGISRGYSHAGLHIIATFLDGICVEEIYKKLDGAEFSQTELDVFINLNDGHRLAWMEDDTRDWANRIWKCAGNGRMMVYMKDIRTLFICTQQFWKDTKRRYEQKEADKLKDF